VRELKRIDFGPKAQFSSSLLDRETLKFRELLEPAF
jgi:hypothetical protein